MTEKVEVLTPKEAKAKWYKEFRKKNECSMKDTNKYKEVEC